MNSLANQNRLRKAGSLAKPFVVLKWMHLAKGRIVMLICVSCTVKASRMYMSMSDMLQMHFSSLEPAESMQLVESGVTIVRFF